MPVHLKASPGGASPGAPPALSDAQVGYLLDLVAVDEGENAPKNLDVDHLVLTLCRIAGRCPGCQGVTGNNDCPVCHGDGYAEGA